MSLNTKYRAYAYWCAKQGVAALSFNAWSSTVKRGKLYD
jgi:hypothetical protein